MSITTRINQQLTLHDGRILGYDEYGNLDGQPVIFMHGFNGSRLDWAYLDSENIAAEMGIRIISVDRPGIGLSDYKKVRNFLDWPADVSELADALGLDRFAVLAVSGGGPYGAACAYRIPERLRGIAIVSGMGPRDAPGAEEGVSWTMPGKPALIRKFLLTMMAMGVRKDPDRITVQMLEMVAKPDRELLQSRPELLQMSLKSMAESFLSGTAGVQQESGLYTRPWGFQLQDITTDIHLWHGEEDENVLVSVGRFVADKIPNCRAKFLANEGHFTLSHNHMGEILSVLVNKG